MIINCFDFVKSSIGGLPSIEVSGMSFVQSIEAPVTTRDTIIMSGNLSTHNGTGKNFCLLIVLVKQS